MRWLGVLLLLWLGSIPAGAGCARETFEVNGYVVCRFDLAQEHLALYNLGADGQPYGSFTALDAALKEKGQSLAFAMNAGMFDTDLKPIGLYVEKGRQLKKLNRRDGGGNFHLKPNGAFYIAGSRAGVLETEAYIRAAPKVDYASQSGPMLVIDGRIHPRFTVDGQSKLRRNGVGEIDGRHVVFAISEGSVNFHTFARLFRDHLGCRNALFLDGSISSLYAPELDRRDGFFSLGPIIGLTK